MPLSRRITHTSSNSALMLMAGLFLFSTTINAQNANSQGQTVVVASDDSTANKEVQPKSGSSITVYIKARFTKRTKGAAKALTKSHAEHEQRGYRFSDLAPYTENGDLQGFFVTYTKI